MFILDDQRVSELKRTGFSLVLECSPQAHVLKSWFPRVILLGKGWFFLSGAQQECLKSLGHALKEYVTLPSLPGHRWVLLLHETHSQWHAASPRARDARPEDPGLQPPSVISQTSSHSSHVFVMYGDKHGAWAPSSNLIFKDNCASVMFSVRL